MIPSETRSSPNTSKILKELRGHRKLKQYLTKGRVKTKARVGILLFKMNLKTQAFQTEAIN